MANARFNLMVKKAQLLRKKHPSIAWATALKKAGAEIRGKKVGAYKVIEKNETVKSKPKKVFQVTRATKKGAKGTFVKGGLKQVAGVHKIGNTATEVVITGKTLNLYKDIIASSKLKLKAAKTVAEKNKIRKEIQLYTLRFNILKKYFNSLIKFV
jgi:hypothetical protein